MSKEGTTFLFSYLFYKSLKENQNKFTKLSYLIKDIAE
ncbi:hypothetical protein SAMN05421846_10935 [Chryseobacterium taeanense]|uniref:Uncharacterized protein n=1 Tax=Chryseobacterium taeanense TaxID=311334 RepID=A0A1G8LAM6_9FLAO|nr:hypothetical protein SAMN05421846_10935 [Chryseobacterium taeanense]